MLTVRMLRDGNKMPFIHKSQDYKMDVKMIINIS